MLHRIQQLVSIASYRLLHCEFIRKTYENIQKAGFDKVELDVFDANELLRPTAIYFFVYLVVPHTSGVATK